VYTYHEERYGLVGAYKVCEEEIHGGDGWALCLCRRSRMHTTERTCPQTGLLSHSGELYGYREWWDLIADSMVALFRVGRTASKCTNTTFNNSFFDFWLSDVHHR